jgi:hypothetical protein
MLAVRRELTRTVAACLSVLLAGPSLGVSGRALSQGEQRFVFRNGFWTNLHHALLADAGRRAQQEALALPLDGLSGGEAQAWSAALDAYDTFKGRSVIFDDELVQINDALTGIPDDRSPTGLASAMTAVLAAAAPVYRRHAWASQRRVNSDWIAAIEPIVERHAVSVTDAIAAAYRTTWPARPIVVDVTSDADVHGGYTTTRGPSGAAGHTTIASPDEKLQGDMAVEIIFHEASHTIDDRIVKIIDDECARQHVRAPPNLWHALLFFTAGEMVRRDLGKSNDPSYQPYADRFGVYERGWQVYRTALGRDWLRYLRGTETFDAALAALIRDSARASQRGS